MGHASRDASHVTDTYTAGLKEKVAESQGLKPCASSFDGNILVSSDPLFGRGR